MRETPTRGMEALQPLRDLATPLADISEPMPYTVVQSAFDCSRAGMSGVTGSRSISELSDDAIDLIVQKGVGRSPGRRIRARLPRHPAHERGGQPRGTRGYCVRRALGALPRLRRRELDRWGRNAITLLGSRAWSDIDGRFGTGGTHLNLTAVETGSRPAKERGRGPRGEPATARRGKGDLRPW